MTKIKVYIFQIIIININWYIVFADCGCNKIERSKNDIVNFLSYDATSGNQFKIEDNCPKLLDEMVKIAGGNYTIGNLEPAIDGESSLKVVHLNEYYIDKYEVSNAQFNEFVKTTGYITWAEKYGDSFVFEGLLTQSQRRDYKDSRIVGAPWWYKVNNTFWRQPEGIASTISDRMDHPVVHVSWFDAVNFCKWKNKRLPSENEWEVACRGGKKNKLFPWGNKLKPKNQHWLNIWQGEFPMFNSVEDGCFSTCPVTDFRQNDFDLYNMVGNVWEWTSTLWNEHQNPQQLETAERVKKGGSYLCHKSYCYRYRCAARSSNTADSSAGNLGFRCARSR